MNALDKLYVSAQIRARIMKEKVKDFMAEQSGVSNVVSTIILLLIVVLIIGIFWGRLKTWLESMMNTIFGETYDTTGMTAPAAPGGGEGQ